MSDDGDSPEFEIKKSVADMSRDKTVYVKADNASDAKELFDHANEAEIK